MVCLSVNRRMRHACQALTADIQATFALHNRCAARVQRRRACDCCVGAWHKGAPNHVAGHQGAPLPCCTSAVVSVMHALPPPRPHLHHHQIAAICACTYSRCATRQVRNLKTFAILNPTSDALNFRWEPDSASADSPAAVVGTSLSCLTRQGSIGFGQRSEMAFEFSPTSPQPLVRNLSLHHPVAASNAHAVFDCTPCFCSSPCAVEGWAWQHANSAR